MELKKEHGYWWPAVEQRSFQRYIDRAPDMEVALKFCKKFDVVVQAGGHCGVWPKRLAKKFKAVYTFEPDAHNFKALMTNVTEPNIYPMRAVIGMGIGTVGLSHNPKNTGGHYVDSLEGDIPNIKVDDLYLKCLDALILDVEGHEKFALMGAAQTIQKYKPVIMIEDNGNTEKKGGYPVEQLYNYLSFLGYEKKANVAKDTIWLPKR